MNDYDTFFKSKTIRSIQIQPDPGRVFRFSLRDVSKKGRVLVNLTGTGDPWSFTVSELLELAAIRTHPEAPNELRMLANSIERERAAAAKAKKS